MIEAGRKQGLRRNERVSTYADPDVPGSGEEQPDQEGEWDVVAVPLVEWSELLESAVKGRGRTGRRPGRSAPPSHNQILGWRRPLGSANGSEEVRDEVDDG